MTARRRFALTATTVAAQPVMLPQVDLAPMFTDAELRTKCGSAALPGTTDVTTNEATALTRVWKHYGPGEIGCPVRVIRNEAGTLLMFMSGGESGRAAIVSAPQSPPAAILMPHFGMVAALEPNEALVSAGERVTGSGSSFVMFSVGAGCRMSYRPSLASLEVLQLPPRLRPS